MAIRGHRGVAHSGHFAPPPFSRVGAFAASGGPSGTTRPPFFAHCRMNALGGARHQLQPSSSFGYQFPNTHIARGPRFTDSELSFSGGERRSLVGGWMQQSGPEVLRKLLLAL